MSLPKMKFHFVLNEKGDTKEFEMPRHAYLKLDPSKRGPNGEGIGRLALTPWNFAGLGGKEGE